MKIRIVERGFEAYTGHFGVIEFKNGLSVADVQAHEIDRLAANIQITDEDGTPVGVAARIVQHQAEIAPVLERLMTAEDMGLPTEKPPVDEPKSASDPMPTFYTEAELAKIGDQGIKALREVGNDWGVKGKAIAELIGDILKAQDDYRRKRGIEASAPAVALDAGVVVEGIDAETLTQTTAPIEQLQGDTPAAAEEV